MARGDGSHRAHRDIVWMDVLSIDSPGGSPVEAERISTALEGFKKSHPKPVAAVINNIGASAAFMIALHADKIIAGKYSLVGSIGAIIAPWQLDRAIAKFDVSQRVYASGRLKSFLNPFTPVSREVDVKAQMLVDQLGAAFLQEVREKRGTRLKEDVDVATGEVWPGPEAKSLGLVDDVGTLEEYVRSNWAGVSPYDLGPNHQGTRFLGAAFEETVTRIIQRLTLALAVVR